MPHVLVVEDSPTQAEKLRFYLEEQGFAASVAVDAEDALKALARQPVDLVISDVVMPGMSGYELCRRIKRSAEWSSIPVVLLTTLKNPVDIVDGLEVGADNFHTKPYEPDALLRKIKTIIENKRLAAEGKLRVGFEVSFLGRRFSIDSDRQQILDLLISTFEQIVETNNALEQKKEELAIARARIENYARQLEERVEIGEARYQALLRSVGDAILTFDRESRITTLNLAAEQLFGVSASDAVGMSIDRLVTISEGIPFSAAIKRVIEGTPSLYANRGVREVVGRRSDSTTFPFEVVVTIASIGKDKLICMSGRDITERKRQEAALHEREERIRLLLESTGEGIYAIDNHGRCTLCNPAAARMLGYDSPNDLIGLEGIQDRIHENPVRRIGEAGHAAPVTFEETGRLLRKDGTNFPASYRSYPIKRNGSVLGSAVIFSDISDRKQLEEELLRSQKMDAIGKLTGGIAHDFNNLLTIVIGNLQLLEDTVEQNSQAEAWLRSAVGAALRGADLTKRLLAFARRQVLEPKVCDVNGLIGNLQELLQRTLGAHVDMSTRLQDGLWLTRIDAGQLENAVINLCVNARDAMPDGGALTIETANKVLDAAYAARHAEIKEGRYVMIAVSDTGSGMPRDVIERAFDPFFTTKSEGRGTGLGLSMVYGFIKQSDGHVKIYSEVGHGTTIKLYLPAEQDDATEDAQAVTRDPTEVAGKGETILLVEDEPSVQEVGVNVLTQLGYNVIRANDGHTALEILAQQDSIDLLFTDIIMKGGLNGTELARRARERWPTIKILFCSGYAENAFSRNAPLERDTYFIGKPYDRNKLASMIRRILDA